MSAREAFTDDEILAAIRAAADRCGQPLSHTRYAGVSQDVGGASVARIIQRFGSWRRACAQAGVATSAPGRRYEQRWDRPAVVAAVSEYFATQDCPGTYADYVVWAKDGQDRPSGATVRNVLGSWSRAKQAAAGSG